MLSIEFEDATFEREAVRADYDLEIGVTATLSLRVSGRLVYREVMFPVVELRLALARWIEAGEAAEDFEYVSMDSDETGWVWFRRQPSGAWRVGSVHQDEIALQEFEWAHLVAAVDRFVFDVDSWVEGHLQCRVADILDI